MTNTVEDIRDIKGFVPVPHGWLWLALIGSALLLVALIWWFKRRKPVVALPVIPPVWFARAGANDGRIPRGSAFTGTIHGAVTNIFAGGRFGEICPASARCG